VESAGRAAAAGFPCRAGCGSVLMTCGRCGDRRGLRQRVLAAGRRALLRLAQGGLGGRLRGAARMDGRQIGA